MSYNNNFRTLPAKIFANQGLAPSSAATLDSGGTVWVTSLIISNVSSNDVALTLTNNEASPVTLYSNTLSAGDHREFTYDEGWEFTGGIRWSAGAGSSIYVQILGRQKG